MSYTIHKRTLEIARPLTRDSNACVRLQRTRFYLVEVLVEDAAVWNCRGYGAGTDKGYSTNLGTALLLPHQFYGCPPRASLP
jgi:hypothetical protein